jgi:hypothetical protein
MAMDILRYVLRHPDAEDSIEGVARWWLMEQRIVDTVRETRVALRTLAERGFVLELGKGRRARYRLNAARRQEAERYVAARGRTRNEHGRRSGEEEE